MTTNRRILALVISLALLATMFCSPASAVESSSSEQIGGIIGNKAVGLSLDTSASDSAQPNLLPNFNYIEIFSMTANKVYDLITTSQSAGKQFYKSDLNGNYFAVAGTVYHSSQQLGIDIKVGVTYYDDWKDEFVPVTEDYFVSGNYSESSHYSPNILDAGKLYYGYINNYRGFAYATGTITFYKLIPAYDINSADNAQTW